jgi:autotransporter-associated beta strand protein
LTGNGGLTKTGPGTLTLESDNTHTYTGPTTIKTGTLELTPTGKLTGAVTVNNTAALTLRGHAGQKVTLAPGATLNAHPGGKIGGDLNAERANLNFHIPFFDPGANAVLNVEGTADITDSRIDVMGTTSPLRKGDSVTLIEAEKGFKEGKPATPLDKLRFGALLTYDLALIVDEEKKRLQARILDSHLNAGSPSLTEGHLAGTAYLNRAADLLIDRGIIAAREKARREPGLTGFAALGGGHLNHKTGSHIDTEGESIVAGLAVTRNLPAGEITLGAFAEHGEGNYNTANSLANARIHGKGHADYTGGGLLARLDYAETKRGRLYAEASARAGRVNQDFSARELSQSAYDSATHYTGAHAGLGYIIKLDERSSLNLYGQYLWNRQGSDTTTLTTREEVKFKAVESHRARLGARWNKSIGETGNAYVGAAWEHEYDGKSKASIHDQRIAAPELKGDTGLAEAGITLTPSATVPLTLDIGIQGYTGKREGVTGSFKANYRF